MKAELTTKYGLKVTDVQRVHNLIIGYVEGKALVWNKDGKRSPNRASKLDLNLSNKHYIAIRRWGNSLKSQIYQTKPTGKGIVKVIEVEI
jgi:hypothetical protein